MAWQGMPTVPPYCTIVLSHRATVPYQVIWYGTVVLWYGTAVWWYGGTVRWYGTAARWASFAFSILFPVYS